MKKHILMLFAVIVVLLLCSCNKTFDGYFYNLDDARADQEIYTKYDSIFTVETEDKIVDFVIDGEKIRVGKIVCRGNGSKKQYRVMTTATYILAENIYDTEGSCYWAKTGNNPYQVEFCILAKGVDITGESFEYFEFNYNGTEYRLCYKIG